MVFPIGAQNWELAADHLDRLPRKSLVNGFVHQRSVTENSNARSADQPQEGAEGRGDETKRNGNDKEASVELRGRRLEGTNLEITTLETSDTVHTGNDEENVEKKEPVGQERIQAEHDEEDGIVAREVAEVIVDTGLDLREVLGLRDTFEVEELSDGTQVREAAGDATRAHASHALPDVETGCEDIDGNLNASHCIECLLWSKTKSKIRSGVFGEVAVAGSM